MSDPYSGTPTFHGTIDVVTDDDEASAAPIATPLEQLQDEVVALHGGIFELRAFTTSGAHTYTAPSWAHVLRVICVGHGGDGGLGDVGGNGGGGGGGAAGEVVERFVVLKGLLDAGSSAYAGSPLTTATINVPPVSTGQVASFAQVGVAGGCFIRARSAYVSNGGQGADASGGTGGAGGVGLGQYAADGGDGGSTPGPGGGQAGDNGYSAEGPSAPSGSNGGRAGIGFGAGGGGGGAPGDASGGSGASGFSGALAGVYVTANAGAASGGPSLGGVGAPGAVFVIAYGLPPVA